MPSFPANLRNWVSARRIAFYVWHVKSAIRKAGALRNLCALVLDFEIRSLEPTFLQLGEVDSDDAVVEYVSRLLTQRPMIEGIEAKAHERSDTTAKLTERARSNDDVRKVVSTFFLVDAFLASFAFDRKNVCLDNARDFVPDAQELDVHGLYSAYARTKKRSWILRKALAERSALKADVTLSALVSLLGIASAILVIAGYLYTTTLLDAFGVDASFFFSLPDYLAGSLEQLRNAGYSAAAGLALFLLGIRNSSLQSKLEYQRSEKQRRSGDRAIFASIVVAAVAVVVGAYAGKPSFPALEMLGVIVAYWSADKIAGMAFKRHRPAFLFLAIVFVFSAHVAIRLYQQIYDLKSGNWGAVRSTRLALKTPLAVPDASLIIISANGNFVFALSKEDRSVYVIPRDNVRLFKIELKGSASQ